MADPTPPIRATLHPLLATLIAGFLLLNAAGLAGRLYHAYHAGPAPSPAPEAPIAIVVGEPGGIPLHLSAPVDAVAWKVLARDFSEVPQQAAGQDRIVAADPSPRLAVASYLSAGKPGLAIAPIPGTAPPAPTPGPLPTPQPDPPKPDPTPTPVPPAPPPPKLAGTFWAVIVADRSKLAGLPAGQRAIVAEPSSLRASIAAMGGSLWGFGVTDPAVTSSKWGKAMVGIELPAIVWIDDKGNVVKAEKMPPDEATIVAETRALKGID